MPLNVRIPLPGPLVYTRRVGGKRKSQGPQTPGQVLGFFAVLSVVMCFLFPPLGISLVIGVVVTTVGYVVLSRRNRRRGL